MTSSTRAVQDQIDTTKEGALTKEEPETKEPGAKTQGSAVTTQAPPQKQELLAPAAPMAGTARARYAAAKVELAQIEQNMGKLEEEKTAVELRFQQDAGLLTRHKNDVVADIDRKLNDANLTWRMVVEQCKTYETAAAKDIGA